MGRALKEAGPLLGLGTSLAATVLLCLGAGYWADGRLGTQPMGLIVGGVFGSAVALYQFFRAVGQK
jgi:F0F1-type ATP synthase assembly protein I